MPLISFKCPECGNLFSIRLDHIPEAATIHDTCPICHRLIKLTPADTTKTPSVQVLKFPQK